MEGRASHESHQSAAPPDLEVRQSASDLWGAPRLGKEWSASPDTTHSHFGANFVFGPQEMEHFGGASKGGIQISEKHFATDSVHDELILKNAGTPLFLSRQSGL